MTTPRIEEKKEFHMMALAKSGSAKEYGDLTVVQLGYVTQLMEEAHQAGIEKGRVSVLEDFDCLMKADAFMGLTDDEWKAVQKFFRYNDEISGWKDDTIKALQDNK